MIPGYNGVLGLTLTGVTLKPFNLILGTPVPANPRPWELIRVPGVMVSAYTLLSNERLRLLARGRGLRRLLGIGDDMTLWIDSGGYQFMKRGIAASTGLERLADKLVSLYRSIEADYYISLDIPPGPREPIPLRAYKIAKNVELYNRMRSLMGELRDKLVPVFHLSWGNLLRVQMNAYSVAEAAAVGGLVPLIMQLDGKHSRRRAVAFLALMRKRWGSWLHTLGLASPAMIPILRVLRMDSGDTQSWRHKAAYGKVVMPGRGERHISDRPVRFGPSKPRDEEHEILYKLMEEARRELGLTPEQIRSDFIARALFNALILHKAAVNGHRYLAISKAWSNLYRYAESLMAKTDSEIEEELERMTLEAEKLGWRSRGRSAS